MIVALERANRSKSQTQDKTKTSTQNQIKELRAFKCIATAIELKTYILSPICFGSM